MMIVAGDPPDFRTISGFRKRYLKALAGLFVQILKLAGKAGLVIIVAHALAASMSDQGQLMGLIDGIEVNLGARPKEASADSGYLGEPHLQALADRGISAYIAAGRAKRPAEVERNIGGPERTSDS